MLNLLNVSLLCLFLLTSHAQDCIKGDCYNGFGTVVTNGKTRYTGEFKQGKMEGKGIYYYSKEAKYIGEWQAGKRHGEGRWFQSNGNVYQGSFKNDSPQGYGIMDFKNGDRYMGQWVLELPNGKGSYYLSNGERYVGEFLNGDFSGQGTYYFKDGSSFKGNWVKGKKEGYGEWTDENGKVFIGQWENDKRTKILEEEQPVVAISKTEINLEELSDGIEEKKTKPEIDLSEAETIIQEETTIKPSTQKENQKLPPTPIIINEEVPDCSVVFCKKGKGALNYSDGSKYVGQFLNGEPHGIGICYYVNGDRYEGNWDKHAPHGEGVMYFKSGLVYGAIWDHGNAVKQIMSKNEFVFNDKIKTEITPEIKVWAVIVGVAKYDHMPSLKYADDDAYKIYAFLKSPEGGALKDNQMRVLIDEDATRINILHSINEIFMRADDNDVVMFYFSGHGLEGTFLPMNYDGFSNAIQHDEIKELFSKSSAKYKVCYADACHSGSLLAAKGSFSSSLLYFFEDLNNSSGGTAFFMSSKDKEFSLEDGGLRQGIFSHYLIKGLGGEADTNKNKTITISELYRYVSEKVKEYTGNAQTPLIAGDYDEQMPVGFVRRD